MSKAKVVTMSAGTRRILEITIKYANDWSDESRRGEDVEAEDVDGATFLIKKRTTRGDEEALVTKTMGEGINITDGMATITLAPVDTQLMAGDYYGTLRLYMDDGGVHDVESINYVDIPYIQFEIKKGAVDSVVED